MHHASAVIVRSEDQSGATSSDRLISTIEWLIAEEFKDVSHTFIKNTVEQTINSIKQDAATSTNSIQTGTPKTSTLIDLTCADDRDKADELEESGSIEQNNVSEDDLDDEDISLHNAVTNMCVPQTSDPTVSTVQVQVGPADSPALPDPAVTPPQRSRQRKWLKRANNRSAVELALYRAGRDAELTYQEIYEDLKTSNLMHTGIGPGHYVTAACDEFRIQRDISSHLAHCVNKAHRVERIAKPGRRYAYKLTSARFDMYDRLDYDMTTMMEQR